MVIIVCAAMFGEYVVIDMVLKGHFWVPDKNWRYIQYNVPEEVTNEYQNYANLLFELIKESFYAVYIQILGVEG